MSLIQSTVIPSSGGYEIDQSLRFEDGSSAYLNRTPSSSGNLKTWTWSCWVKRGNLGINNKLLGTTYLSQSEFYFKFNANDKLQYGSYAAGGGGDNYTVVTTPVFRDTSAWYHIVFAWDTTQGTDTNRIKLYVNGERITSFDSTTYPPVNFNGYWNSSAYVHYIGTDEEIGSKFDGYLGEVNFVDGQALTPSDFGETGDYGEWKPIEYSGSYGTNGFYLPFKQDYTVEGFSATTYTGNGVSGHSIGGSGFQPDLTWIKQRSGGYSHIIANAISGSNKFLNSAGTAAEETDSTKFQTFTTDGFKVGTHAGGNSNGQTYVAWNWDMGGSNATNTAGSIQSTVRANAAYGQSIVSYVYGSGAQTIGHGLTAAPELILMKNREYTHNWDVYHKDVGNTKRLILNSTVAPETYSGVWNDTTPTSSVFSTNNWLTNGHNVIAYCFHSVTGYSKFGSYEGTGSGGSPTVTTGFKPAFIVAKDVDGVDSWRMYDNTRTPNIGETILYPNLSNAEDSSAISTNWHFTTSSTGFTLNTANSNTNGRTYIYMAFADTREYAYWLDQSGNNNDWTSNNLTESDVMVDSPTNNFATWNPLTGDNAELTTSEGNLRMEGTANSCSGLGSIIMESGKWYWEVLLTKSNTQQVGIIAAETIATNDDTTPGDVASGYIWLTGNGDFYNGGATSITGSTTTTNDIIGVAFDADTGELWFAKNNTWQNSGAPASGTGEIWTVSSSYSTYVAVCGAGGSSDQVGQIINFGQDSSFAANKTAQGNQDGNDIGDFYYAPPTGFLALCTSNLPDVAVIPSEHFTTLLNTGDSSGDESFTTGFQPDWVWSKPRSLQASHEMVDSVRGVTKVLMTDRTDAESTDANSVKSFNSNGFTLGTNSGGWNRTGRTYVYWNWKANGSGSSNTDGSINTTKTSANVDAGFSISTYTGNGSSSATIGHGLSKAPEMVIVKRRNSSANWAVWHQDLSSYTHKLYLNDTIAEATGGNPIDAAPTATVLELSSSGNSNGNGATYIAYAFHSVDGYSKMGSYTGNNSVDGPFVYTGFRPAFILRKRTDTTAAWIMQDNRRPGSNRPRADSLPTDNNVLRASDSSAEEFNNELDILSNGFKLRATDTFGNASGGTYIYLAFAESPFKYSNAR